MHLPSVKLIGRLFGEALTSRKLRAIPYLNSEMGSSSYGCGSPFSRAHSCQCNDKCTKHANCCADYASMCQRSLSNHCSGSQSINFYGHGCVQLVNAQWNVPGELAGPVHVERNRVKPYLAGRTYFSMGQSSRSFDSHSYLAIRLLGKRFSYTTDISGVGCGCNAAVYFTSMHQEKRATKCGDFYCDAARVCGASCAEIDVQEANMFAYRSTLHSDGDETGWSAGLGGYGPHTKVWKNDEYGPHGTCIKTTNPYAVAAEFPVGEDGNLKELRVSLSQAGCSIELSVQGYNRTAELTRALRAGMTPILSYWKSKAPWYLSWVDGWWMNGTKKLHGDGPCEGAEEGMDCGSHVKFYDFKLATL
eukprot:TRINITY_DN11047_c0_g1_i1.p1 TRINITY_DN11047_c0_g1~~TRINITY_DN11047_c0_g1_i1.p1  ORF type:complete len:361 (-),score=43.69 TRINITY_DN11047_c0_g1_i1:47-1129(-)